MGFSSQNLAVLSIAITDTSTSKALKQWEHSKVDLLGIKLHMFFQVCPGVKNRGKIMLMSNYFKTMLHNFSIYKKHLLIGAGFIQKYEYRASSSLHCNQQSKYKCWSCERSDWVSSFNSKFFEFFEELNFRFYVVIMTT